MRELLEQLSSNDDFLKFLAGIVTDQDFRQQHGKLLQLTYGMYVPIGVMDEVCVCACVRACVCTYGCHA